MEIEVIKTELKAIQHLRARFLDERNFQFTYDKCHLYGWADTYLFLLDGKEAGYGSVWGKEKREDRDSIFEFYLIQPYEKMAHQFFSVFQNVSGASYIECQSNDFLLTSMLYEHSKNISAEAILFRDHHQTRFVMPGVILQPKKTEEISRYDRQYILKHNAEVVASGGMMLNYNMPYADLYYEVHEGHRQKGYGSFLVQELKKAAYEMNRVPAARCNIKNHVSKATLLKAGFVVCGWRLNGTIQG